MKKVLLFAVMLLLGLASLHAQTTNEPIVIEKGHKFSYQGQMVTNAKTMKAIVANNELALKEAKKAGVANGFSMALAGIGGFAMGWELGNVIGGREFNPYVFGGGLGVAAIGLGLIPVYLKHMTKSATIYNEGLGTTAYGNPIKIDLGLVPGGIGMTLSF